MWQCVCGELPERGQPKRGFNTIADQMGKGQGMRFTSEDTQLGDKWGQHSVSVDIEERQIRTTVLCLLKQQRKVWQRPVSPRPVVLCNPTQMDPGECIIWKTHLKPIVKSHANVYALYLKENV